MQTPARTEAAEVRRDRPVALCIGDTVGTATQSEASQQGMLRVWALATAQQIASVDAKDIDVESTEGIEEPSVRIRCSTMYT